MNCSVSINIIQQPLRQRERRQYTINDWCNTKAENDKTIDLHFCIRLSQNCRHINRTQVNRNNYDEKFGIYLLCIYILILLFYMNTCVYILNIQYR